MIFFNLETYVPTYLQIIIKLLIMYPMELRSLRFTTTFLLASNKKSQQQQITQDVISMFNMCTF